MQANTGKPSKPTRHDMIATSQAFQCPSNRDGPQLPKSPPITPSGGRPTPSEGREPEASQTSARVPSGDWLCHDPCEAVATSARSTSGRKAQLRFGHGALARCRHNPLQTQRCSTTPQMPRVATSWKRSKPLQTQWGTAVASVPYPSRKASAATCTSASHLRLSQKRWPRCRRTGGPPSAVAWQRWRVRNHHAWRHCIARATHRVGSRWHILPAFPAHLHQFVATASSQLGTPDASHNFPASAAVRRAGFGHGSAPHGAAASRAHVWESTETPQSKSI